MRNNSNCDITADQGTLETHTCNKTLTVDDWTYSHFTKTPTYVGKINIMDFFPTLMNRRIGKENTISNVYGIVNIRRILLILTIPKISRLEADQINEQDLIAVEDEELLSQQLFYIIDELNNKFDGDDMYSLIYLAGLFEKDKLLMRLLIYPGVNPLVASIRLDREDLITKYLLRHDPRSGYMEAYNISKEMGTKYYSLVKDNVLLRIFLDKQVLSLISRDIYCYYISSGLIYI